MTIPEPLDLTGPLWRFALAVHARPGIPEACLALQADAGVDVPLMLGLLHARAQHRAVTPAVLTEARALVAPWQGRVVAALRQVRTGMKGDDWMARFAPVSPLREQIKALELRAEQIQIAVLDRHLAALPASAAPPTPEDLCAVIRLCAGGDHPAVDPIASAAAAEISRA